MCRVTPSNESSEQKPVSTSASPHSKSILEKVLTFIDLGGRQPASKPGFAHALRVSLQTIDKKELSLGDGKKTLTYRYRFCHKVSKPTIGLLSALQDELGTNALFRVGLPSGPGASLQMHTELLPNKTLPEKEMDVVNVVDKLGRTISFTKTYFKDVETQETFAYATHVKYMPTGSWLFDAILTNQFVFFLWCRMVVFLFPNRPIYDEKELFQEVVGSNLEHHGIGRATFHMTKEHTNPTGAMHGGCIAMALEQAGEAFVKATWNKDPKNFRLDSMQIEYPSAARGKNLNIECETLGYDDETFHVRAVMKRGDRITSDGKLRFSTV